MAAGAHGSGAKKGSKGARGTFPGPNSRRADLARNTFFPGPLHAGADGHRSCRPSRSPDRSPLAPPSPSPARQGSSSHHPRRSRSKEPPPPRARHGCAITTPRSELCAAAPAAQRDALTGRHGPRHGHRARG
nr:uncharacterized protein LOC127347021 [Lolium perenne]